MSAVRVVVVAISAVWLLLAWMRSAIEQPLINVDLLLRSARGGNYHKLSRLAFGMLGGMLTTKAEWWQQGLSLDL
jgi:hypothetical protein